MRDAPKLRWSKIYEQWQQHSVAPPEIRKFDSTKHLPGVPWIKKDADKNINSFFAVSSPQSNTAAILAEGSVTRTPEVFSAFAIHAFLIYKDAPYSLGLIQASREALDKLDPPPVSTGRATLEEFFFIPMVSATTFTSKRKLPGRTGSTQQPNFGR